MFMEYDIPRRPVILSENDWCVESPPQHSILVPLPFSECDWIPRDIPGIPNNQFFMVVSNGWFKIIAWKMVV